MKHWFVSLFLAAMLMLALTAFLPSPALAMVQSSPPVEETLPPDVLNVVITVVLGFVSLVGMSKLVAALVNLLKIVKLVKDGTADMWAAGLNLAAFIALVLVGVFRPDVTMQILDGYAGQIAMVILYVLGFVIEMTGSKPAHDALAEAGVPLIGKSFSRDA